MSRVRVGVAMMCRYSKRCIGLKSPILSNIRVFTETCPKQRFLVDNSLLGRITKGAIFSEALVDLDVHWWRVSLHRRRVMEQSKVLPPPESPTDASGARRPNASVVAVIDQ